MSNKNRHNKERYDTNRRTSGYNYYNNYYQPYDNNGNNDYDDEDDYYYNDKGKYSQRNTTNFSIKEKKKFYYENEYGINKNKNSNSNKYSNAPSNFNNNNINKRESFNNNTQRSTNFISKEANTGNKLIIKEIDNSFKAKAKVVEAKEDSNRPANESINGKKEQNDKSSINKEDLKSNKDKEIKDKDKDKDERKQSIIAKYDDVFSNTADKSSLYDKIQAEPLITEKPTEVSSKFSISDIFNKGISEYASKLNSEIQIASIQDSVMNTFNENIKFKLNVNSKEYIPGNSFKQVKEKEKPDIDNQTIINDFLKDEFQYETNIQNPEGLDVNIVYNNMVSYM